MKNHWLLPIVMAFILSINNLYAMPLTEVIKQIKPSVVGIGLYTPTSQPQNVLLGSGFAVADGLHIVTNYHVVPEVLDTEKLQKIAVFIGTGPRAEVRIADIVVSNKKDDLIVLKITGKPLPALTLADDKLVDEGTEIAFTGFPIGAVLGLYPVTHRGIISSVTPIAVPVVDSRQMNVHLLKQLRDPYVVYQLDATAYPGNSGSVLYQQNNGKVVGVINKVFVQQSKEAVIEKPSGITYAIPVKHLRQLLRQAGITV